MKNYNFETLKKKSENIIKQGWFECKTTNKGEVGLLFERLLGLPNHNLYIPDYENIEIKTKITNSKQRLTLFNATPDNNIFEIKRIHDRYGYPDSTHQEFKIFNIAFYSDYKSYINKEIYGKIYVDRGNEKVSLYFFDNKNNIIDDKTSWSFKLLEERMNLKLRYLFIMYAKGKKYKNKTYCKYLYYKFFVYKGFKYFLKAIEKGRIRISFSICVYKKGPRYGKIYDHGTSFDIDLNHINEVFNEITLTNIDKSWNVS